MAEYVVEDHSKEVLAALQDAMEKAGETIGLLVEGGAKLELENEPRRVDTGLLRNSITHALDGEAPAIGSYHGDKVSKYSKVQAIPFGNYSGRTPKGSKNKRTVYIGSNVEYSEYVHEGTRKTAPNRFLKNAAEKAKGDISDIIRQAMENA